MAEVEDTSPAGTAASFLLKEAQTLTPVCWQDLAQHFPSTSNPAPLGSLGSDLSSTPGVLKTTCVPLEPCPLLCREISVDLEAWPAGSQVGQTYGTHSGHTCPWEPGVGAEFLLLAAQWPPPALCPAPPRPSRSRHKRGPQLHLHGTSLCFFPLDICAWTSAAPWKSTPGTADSEPS